VDAPAVRITKTDNIGTDLAIDGHAWGGRMSRTGTDGGTLALDVVAVFLKAVPANRPSIRPGSRDPRVQAGPDPVPSSGPRKPDRCPHWTSASPIDKDGR